MPLPTDNVSPEVWEIQDIIMNLLFEGHFRGLQNKDGYIKLLEANGRCAIAEAIIAAGYKKVGKDGDSGTSTSTDSR